MWSLAELLCCRMSSLLLLWKVKPYSATYQCSMLYSRSHRQRICLRRSPVLRRSTSTHWCTLKSAASSSEISRIATRGGITPPCMLLQSLYLACIAQIDCRGSVESQVEGIYLIRVASCPPCHHLWLALAPHYDLQLVPPCGRSSLKLVCHKLDMLFYGGISHVKKLSTS